MNFKQYFNVGKFNEYLNKSIDMRNGIHYALLILATLSGDWFSYKIILIVILGFMVFEYKTLVDYGYINGNN